MENENIALELKEAVINYNANKAKELAIYCVQKDKDLLKCVAALTEGINIIGKGFEQGELFLPSLMGAANVLETAMPILNEGLKGQGKKSSSLGKIIIGTVFGDVHNIGKNMVATLLAGEGFEVIDLGINVKAEIFLEKAGKESPKIIALSALLTTTMPEQEKVIKLLSDAGIREKIKVIIGGGPVTQDYADKIGADGYEDTAFATIKLVKKILNKS